MLLPETVINIVAYGGGVTIDTSKYLPDTLIRIAATASQSGATVTLKNCNLMLPDTMYKIAAAGRGRIIFEIE